MDRQNHICKPQAMPLSDNRATYFFLANKKSALSTLRRPISFSSRRKTRARARPAPGGAAIFAARQRNPSARRRSAGSPCGYDFERSHWRKFRPRRFFALYRPDPPKLRRPPICRNGMVALITKVRFLEGIGFFPQPRLNHPPLPRRVKISPRRAFCSASWISPSEDWALARACS